jgi:predicted regulator of Ras-like GTPase activity (Roadblock/LC7/MglB family)
MFGFVKNWLRGPVIEKPAGPPPTIEPRFHNRPPALPATNGTMPGQDEAQDGVNVLHLPLAAIFPKLPADLQSKVKLPVDGQAQIVVPLPLIFAQLGRGAIKITFGVLRSMAPENTFYAQTDRDQAVVELPLGEVLARISPEMLPRRAQKTVTIPEEISSPFAANGQGVHIYKPAPTPPTSFVKRQVELDPFQAAPGFPARGQLTSVPPMTQPAAALPEDKPIAMPKSPAPQVPPPARVLVHMAGQPAKRNGSVMTVALADLAAAWPDLIRAEILQSSLAEATVSLPAELMEESLKKGKAVFPWQQIRSWTNSPEAALAFSPNDATLLELPLRVLTPLFLARLQSTQAAAKKVAVDQNIPNLFAAGPRSENGTAIVSRAGTSFFPKPAVEPVAPAPQPVNDPAPAPKAPAMANGKPQTARDGKADTEFLRRFATPNDIVGRAASLEGVTGALVALPDGLLVAGNLPANTDGDGLAAFTPQIFARVSQSTREFRMGELKDLTFTVGNTPWKIFKAGSVFFAAFGQTETPLPEAALAELASALEHKSK